MKGLIKINYIKLRARAKINISLDILGTFPNGYHNLRMIMQTVNLCDYIFIKKLPSFPGEIQLNTNLAWLSCDNRNLAWKAAKAMIDKYNLNEGVYIDITKNIPVAAGLAGGSADCAAVLVGMNILFDINAPINELIEIGVKLGADVPYCIMRGTVLAEGIGEKLTLLDNFPFCYVILSKPNVNISTASIFGIYDSMPSEKHPNTDYIISKIKEGNLEEISSNMVNVLEAVTIKEVPIIEKIKSEMLSSGALGAMMSGSGPTVFGLYDDREKAVQALRKLKHKLHINQTYLATIYNPRRR